MSTYKYPHPNGETYKIGTEGWVFNDSGRPNNILDDARDSILAAIRTLFPGIGYIPSILVGWIAGDGAYCPTYGLWTGPGIIFFVTSGVMTNSYCDTVSARQ